MAGASSSSSRRDDDADARRARDARDRAVPVSLGAPSLRRRLEAYYSLIAPETIASEADWLPRFDLIRKKYGGTEKGERVLAARLEKKYGSAVRLLVATEADGRRGRGVATGGGRRRSDTTTTTTTTTRDESWFELTAAERGSGVADLASDRFDPAAALRATEEEMRAICPFVVGAPRLDNVSKARALLPEYDPQRVVRTTTTTTTTTTDAPTTKPKHKKLPVLSALAARFETGPASTLCAAHARRRRVRVMIRYVDGVRGTVTGRLLAFDKHLNMILIDADEVYTPRTTTTTTICDDDDASAAEVEARRRRRGRPRRRYLRQTLIRGDNVVMVWSPDAERSCPKSDLGTPGSLADRLLPPPPPPPPRRERGGLFR